MFADNIPFLQRLSACDISAEDLEGCVRTASFPVIFSNDVLNDPRFSPHDPKFWQLPAFHVHSGNSRELVNRPELRGTYAESVPLREFMKNYVHPVEGFREEELIEDYQLVKFEPDTHIPRLKKWLSLSSDLLVTTLRTSGTITYVWDSRGLHNDYSMNFPMPPSTSH